MDLKQLRTLVFVTPVVFTLAAAGLGWQAAQQAFFWPRAEAEVVRVYAHDDGTFSPVFRYVWTDGQPTEASAGTRDAGYGFAVGERVGILFDPDRKADVIVPDFAGLWGLPLVIGAMGAVAWIVALAVWPRVRRRSGV